MSSAATLAVALQCAEKCKPLRKDMVQFGIPLFANIHLCGSVLTEVFFCMTVSKILYGTVPTPGTMILFCVLLWSICYWSTWRTWRNSYGILRTYHRSSWIRRFRNCINAYYLCITG